MIGYSHIYQNLYKPRSICLESSACIFFWKINADIRTNEPSDQRTFETMNLRSKKPSEPCDCKYDVKGLSQITIFEPGGLPWTLNIVPVPFDFYSNGFYGHNILRRPPEPVSEIAKRPATNRTGADRVQSPFWRGLTEISVHHSAPDRRPSSNYRRLTLGARYASVRFPTFVSSKSWQIHHSEPGR